MTLMSVLPHLQEAVCRPVCWLVTEKFSTRKIADLAQIFITFLFLPSGIHSFIHSFIHSYIPSQQGAYIGHYLTLFLDASVRNVSLFVCPSRLFQSIKAYSKAFLAHSETPQMLCPSIYTSHVSTRRDTQSGRVVARDQACVSLPGFSHRRRQTWRERRTKRGRILCPPRPTRTKTTTTTADEVDDYERRFQ